MTFLACGTVQISFPEQEEFPTRRKKRYELGVFSLKEIEFRARIFDPPKRRLNKFEQRINEAARELSIKDGKLLFNQVKRLNNARKKVTKEFYKKKRSGKGKS